MKRLLTAALVGGLLFPGFFATSFSHAAEEKEKPSGVPVMWVGDGKSFDTAIFFISARSQTEAVVLEYVHLKKNLSLIYN